MQMYWIGPLIGGALAALLYDLVFAANASTDKTKAFFTKKDYDDADHEKPTSTAWTGRTVRLAAGVMPYKNLRKC